MRLSNTYKTMNGRINAEAEVENNVIISIKFGGDFYLKPEGALLILEKHLNGVELRRELVTNAVNTFYLFGIESLNATKEELVDAILGLRDNKISAKI